MKYKLFTFAFILILLIFATPRLSFPNHVHAGEISSESGADSGSGSDTSADSGSDTSADSGSLGDSGVFLYSSLIFVLIICVFLLYFCFGGKNI